MRCVIQRVSSAEVRVDGRCVGSIGVGLCVLVGITHNDTDLEAAWMAEKLLALRVFPDHEGKMNRSLADTGGGLLIVSQFTVYGRLAKGTRPSYSEAARPEIAQPLMDRFVAILRQRARENPSPVHIETGVFGAHMQVSLNNDGPVTIILDRPPTA